MKSLMVITLLSGLITASCTGQRLKQDKVPSVVVNTLKAKYPTANQVEWKKVSNQYEAELELNSNQDVTLRIDASGKTIMMKENLPVQELVPAVTAILKEKYAEYSIDDVDKIQKDGLVFYQVDLDARKEKDVKLVFIPDGTIAESQAYWD
jgi:biopolymer transport protein ExbD